MSLLFLIMITGPSRMPVLKTPGKRSKEDQFLLRMMAGWRLGADALTAVVCAVRDVAGPVIVTLASPVAIPAAVRWQPGSARFLRLRRAHAHASIQARDAMRKRVPDRAGPPVHFSTSHPVGRDVLNMFILV